MSLILRATKGSLLTIAEMDGNLTYLDGKSAGIMPPRVFYLSQNGVSSDADLSIGSATFGVDNTAIIQAILDTAGDTNPIVVINDCRASVSKIRLKSNTTLRTMEGCGLIQRPFSNVPLVALKNNVGMGAIATSNIIIDGGIYNGTGFYNGAYGQAKEGLQGTGGEGWVVIFRIAGVRNLRITNVKLWNPRNFCSFINNFEDVVFTDVEARASSQINYGNVDGCKFIHGTGLKVSNVYGNTKDDILSIGTNDCFFPVLPLPTQIPNNPGQTAYDPAGSYGPLYDVDISFIRMQHSSAGIRWIGVSERADRIVIRNLTGTQDATINFIIDSYHAGGDPSYVYQPAGNLKNGDIGSIVLDGINVVRPTAMGYGEIFVGVKIEHLHIRNFRRTDFNSGDPCILFGPTAMVGRATIEIDALSSSNAVTPLIKNQGSIKTLEIIHSNYDKSPVGGYTNTPVVRLESGSVQTVIVAGVLLDSCSPVIDWIGGSLTQVIGRGVVMLGDAGKGFIDCHNNTLNKITLSNYSNNSNITHSGVITTKNGDAYVNNAGAVQAFAPAGTYVDDANTSYRTQSAAAWQTATAAKYYGGSISYLNPGVVGDSTYFGYGSGIKLYASGYAAGASGLDRGAVGLTVNGVAITGCTQRVVSPNGSTMTFAYFVIPAGTYPAGTKLTVDVSSNTVQSGANTIYFEDDGCEFLV